MFRTLALGLVSALFFPAMLACEKTPAPVVPEASHEERNEQEDVLMPETIKITVSGKSLPVKIVENEATKALVAALREASITYEADDYGGFEKVGPLGTSLPTNDERITTEPGDVILYQGDQITVYYDENTWNFTKLGRLNADEEEILEAFGGKDDITAEFFIEWTE